MTMLKSKTNKIKLSSATLFFLAMLWSVTGFTQITVFPECNFIGSAVTLPEGDYTTNELRQLGVADNSIASIIVSEGYGAQLFLDDRFAGSPGKLLKMNPCLEQTRYYKDISSLSVFAVDQNGNPVASSNTNNDSFSLGDPQPSTVELFSECYFEGRSITVDAGKFTTSQLGQLGLADNTISSIRVPKGMKIELFENDFFRGRSGKLGANSDCLVERFNDQVSSVVVTGAAQADQGTDQTQAAPELPPVLVYNRCNYGGQGARLPVGEYMAKDLAALGLADNTIASIRVPEGMEALIYENDFSRGRSTRVSTSARCLTGSQFENIISSVSVVQTSTAVQKPLGTSSTTADQVSIFTDCKFKGRFAELPMGEYSARDLKALGFADNSISAIKVAPGMTVTVYENDLYRGGSLELSDDEPCLTNRRANDAISSLIVKKTETDKPFVSVLSASEKQRLAEGLQCVKPYVEKNLCNADSWNVVRNFCSLDQIALMDDGYLEGHVNAGNCTVKNWPTLVQRISDPSLR